MKAPATLTHLVRLLILVLSVTSIAASASGQPPPSADLARYPVRFPQQARDAVCVDGSMSGRPFAQANCVRTVATLEEAVHGLGPGALVVVRAFWSRDENSIAGSGTYRGSGLSHATLASSLAAPIVIQAEGFHPNGSFVKPIVSGAVRVHGQWEATPGTQRTWHIAWEVRPGSYGHEGCVDRIWVSRAPGKNQLANFPLTRPLFAQGNPHDCLHDTSNGEPLTPQHVDGFPGSYLWKDGVLYVRMPNGENPNQYTVEVPYFHSLTAGRGSSGLIIRGFRVYHSMNGIDLYHCGGEPENRCEATHNETSFNTHFGLQPGRHSLLAWNSGILNTIQLIKVTGHFSEIAYNNVGPQLAHGFKLNDVHGCRVHHNQVYGNNIRLSADTTQAGWLAVGTRDTTAGIYLKNGTQGCHVHDNNVRANRVGIYIRNDGDTLTRDNVIERNSIYNNELAIVWRDEGLWNVNISRDNWFSWGAQFYWGGLRGQLSEYRAGTGLDGWVPAPARTTQEGATP
jgi:parallel beta-helix repeat protein